MEESVITNPLASDQQRRFEQAFLRKLAGRDYQKFYEYVVAQLQSHHQAGTEEGRSTLNRVAAELCANGLAQELNNNPLEPAAIAFYGPLHNWFGDGDMPAAGSCLINPDNHIRWMPVSSDYYYRITGQLIFPHAADFSFSSCSFVLKGEVESGATRSTLPGTQGCLSAPELQTDTQGNFVINVGVENTYKAENFLTIGPETTHIVLRDTMGDWLVENPCTLDVERLGKANDHALAEQSCSKLAAPTTAQRKEIMQRELDIVDLMHYQTPPAKMPEPKTLPSGLVTQLLSTGNFALRDDEIMLITADPLDAAYFAVQVADPWSWGEYQEHISSLNHAQAKKDADGKFRFVLSTRDEGVYNWLDTQGLSRGSLAVRWQCLSDVRAEIPDDVLHVQLIGRESLFDHLPANTVRVTPGQRQQQLAERKQGWQRRFYRREWVK